MFSRGECFKEREQTIPNLIVGEFQKQQTSGNAVRAMERALILTR